MEQRLGIPSSGFEYQNLLQGQDGLEEYIKTEKFLAQVFNEDIRSCAPELFSENMYLQFINYGDTELVYVLETNLRQYTVLVGQPAVKNGTIRKEYDNLQLLAELEPDVIVKPEYYFTNNERELYITPYFFQARCIASQNHGWGIYIPEPYYRFENFSSEEETFVNISIIANLVRLYNEKQQVGLASCKIGGGDFILQKEWSIEPKSIENTLKKMKLIAARELIQTSFNNYLEMLRNEFSIRTYYKSLEERDPSIFINHKSRVPMRKEDIDAGIQLGMKLRNVKK